MATLTNNSVFRPALFFPTKIISACKSVNRKFLIKHFSEASLSSLLLPLVLALSTVVVVLVEFVIEAVVVTASTLEEELTVEAVGDGVFWVVVCFDAADFLGMGALRPRAP